MQRQLRDPGGVDPPPAHEPEPDLRRVGRPGRRPRVHEEDRRRRARAGRFDRRVHAGVGGEIRPDPEPARGERRHAGGDHRAGRSRMPGRDPRGGVGRSPPDQGADEPAEIFEATTRAPAPAARSTASSSRRSASRRPRRTNQRIARLLQDIKTLAQEERKVCEGLSPEPGRVRAPARTRDRARRSARTRRPRRRNGSRRRIRDDPALERPGPRPDGHGCRVRCKKSAESLHEGDPGKAGDEAEDAAESARTAGRPGGRAARPEDLAAEARPGARPRRQARGGPEELGRELGPGPKPGTNAPGPGRRASAHSPRAPDARRLAHAAPERGRRREPRAGPVVAQGGRGQPARGDRRGDAASRRRAQVGPVDRGVGP